MNPTSSFAEREDMNLSEFNSKPDHNIQHFIKYQNRKTGNPQNRANEPEYQQKAPKSQETVHVQSIQVSKTQRGPQKPHSLMKHRQPNANKQSINSLTYIERQLVTLPSEVLSKQSLINLLDLSVNRFDAIPSQLMQLKMLKILRLDHNRIKSIPTEICQLEQLEVISLSYNFIQVLPKSFSQLNGLQELNIEFNLLDSIEPGLADTPNLRILNMSRNRFAIFPSAFHKMSNLTELTFEWFKYASPPLSSRQRGKAGEARIEQLRVDCKALAEKNQKGVNFPSFLEIVSTEEVKLHTLDESERSFLHYAALYEDVTVMKYMISYMPSLLDKLDVEGQTPLSLSVAKEKYFSARYLLKHGANPVKGGGIYGSPLHIATRKLNFQLVKDIIHLGENLNKIDKEGHTPLHHSLALMADGNPRAVIITQFLLESGGNPNAKNKECWAPLHLVVRKRDVKGVDWIVIYNREAEEVHGREEKFNLNKKGGAYKWTPLHIATYMDSSDIVESLAMADADIFKRCLNGNVPKVLLRGYGVTMKYLEKYEKSWIHRKVLFKKQVADDCVEDANLKNLNSTREIGNASKNKFENSWLYTQDRYDQKVGLDDPCFLSYANRKLQIPISFKATHKVLSKNHDDSFEIQPETETNLSFDNEESDAGRLDFYNELNEDINIESRTFTRNLTMSSRHSSAKQIRHTRIPSKNKFAGNFIQFLDIDVENYQQHINNQADFGLEFCKHETKLAKDCFNHERLLFSEKLKIFVLLRVLFFKILEYIKTNLNITLTQETFGLLPMKDPFASNFKTSRLGFCRRQEIHLASMLYELIPQCLIDIYATVAQIDYESCFIKSNIISMFEELVYYPAVDFLEAVSTKSNDMQFVKMEAQRVGTNLKSMYETCVMHCAFNKENKCSSNSARETKKPLSIKPQVSPTFEEMLGRQSAPIMSGPHFNAKASFVPIKISDHIDKML